ncbi:hypothetical protein BCR44DRAFT_1512291 [Catenaria anguillulae PL171]|uniref:Uncharacterized protein n=1 Tax=Catenaria anguillulae PL171 TaxID=765915 RepID=A0A1Y2HT46_9FUNG|nr:hypothetical protein BCR44DRAFT_1512291 [Catenaria anguillulae PL171]
MTVFEAINNISMISDVWTHRHANFILYQIVVMFTFNPSGPLFVIAMSHRISCIIVMRPTWKLWFLRAVMAAAVFIICQSSIIVFVGILNRLDLDTAGWLKARLFPSWTAVTLSFLPLFTIGGSIWSLQIAFSYVPSPVGSSNGSESSMTMSPPSQINANRPFLRYRPLPLRRNFRLHLIPMQQAPIRFPQSNTASQQHSKS